MTRPHYESGHTGQEEFPLSVPGIGERAVTGSSWPEEVRDGIDPTMESMLPAEHWDALTPPKYDANTGEWVVSSYGDVRDMLTRPDLYSVQFVPNENVGDPNVPAHLRGYWMRDSPLKEALAAPLHEYFSQDGVARLEGSIQEAVNTQLNEIGAEGGTFDYTPTLGTVPDTVIKTMLNLRPDQEGIVKRIQSAIHTAADGSRFAEAQQEWAEVDRMLEQILEQREAELDPAAGAKDPADAIILGIVQNTEQEPLLGDEATRRWWARGQVAMLIAAGDDTTRALLGNTLQGISHHQLWDQLRQDPTLIRGAVEEMARRYPSYPASRGIARQKIVIGRNSDSPQTVEPGQVVQARISAANFDPREFDDPLAVNIRREHNYHLTYGQGGRHCTGAFLARQIISTTIESILSRYPNGLEWDENPVQRTPGLVNSIPAGEGGLHLIVR